MILAPLNPLFGKSMQFDPVFAYYRERSAESVAREIEVGGYRTVRYIVTNDLDVDDRFIDAFHRRGMKVWYQTFGNGFYGKPRGMPAGWQKWQMVLLHKDEATYTFLSLSSPQYRAWKVGQITKVMREHRFDGAEVAEPFQMGWDGPEKGSYGDLSQPALAAFERKTSFKEPPDFSDPKSARFYRTDVARYRKWVEFRVHEVCNFVRDLRVGTEKARSGRPFSVWTLANRSQDPKRSGPELIREWQGVDAVEIERVAKPDLICFETNWPDWMTPGLPGDYPKDYSGFTQPLQSAFPGTPYIIQADLGSSPNSRRSRSWIAEFEAACLGIGATGSTLYMHGIEGWIYTEPPEIKAVEPTRDGLLLVFQKRLEAKSAALLKNYSFTPPVKVRLATWDGNLVRLSLSGYNANRTYKLTVNGVLDDPRQWIFKGSSRHECRQSLTIPKFP